MPQTLQRFIIIMVLAAFAAMIAIPKDFSITLPAFLNFKTVQLGSPVLNFSFFGRNVYREFEFRTGLDIQGGMQVVLAADMTDIRPEDQEDAIASAREIIARRVDLYGIAEPSVKTAKVGEQWRIIVELPGLKDQEEALALIGQTAELEFHLLSTRGPSADPEATSSAESFGFEPTNLTGKQLNKSAVQFDQQTGEPVVSLEFDEEGREMFADITKNNQGELLAILLDGNILMAPQINVPILNGQAVIQGSFNIDEAKQLSIQLNSGALPVPITILEQQTIGASLGQESVRKSVIAGLVGLVTVMFFMIAMYGWSGVLASFALVLYGIFTIALYKILNVTVTLPGIAGLLLSVGMAVDANILIFERMKEERRLGKSFSQAMELGFGRAWDSIKDANIATILTALVLINPLDFSFLNSAGLVRGFGITLLIGVLLGLFTGVFVTRTLLRLFLHEGEKS